MILIGREDTRTANVIADDPEGVCCLVIDGDTFKQLISSIKEIHTKYVDEGITRRKCVLLLLFLFIFLSISASFVGRWASCFLFGHRHFICYIHFI